MKKCLKCGELKEQDEFYPNGYRKDGERIYRPRCRKCEGKTNRRIKAVERGGKRQCVACKEFKELQNFDGVRSKCHSCRNNERWEGVDPVLKKCHEMAGSARARVYAPSRGYKKSYRGLQEPFGFENIRDMANYLYEAFYVDIKSLIDAGEVPTVDRIVASVGYTPENIRIAEFTANTMDGVAKRRSPVRAISPEGEVLEFASVQDCATHFGTLESHVRTWLKKKHKPRNGYTYEYN